MADGDVFNVKAYGAVGDGATDDTTAVQTAVHAANAIRSAFTESLAVDSGKGAVVYFPPGIYLIRAEIHLSSAVTIRGAGMYTTQLRMSTSEPGRAGSSGLRDGLVWDIGPETPDAHHVGSGIEDIDVITQTEAAHTPQRAARHLVVLRRQHNFHITNVRVHGALQHGVRMEDCVHVTALNLFTHSCGTAGVKLASARVGNGLSYNTTINFQSCYFQNTSNGPGADVSGYGITFDGCVFESGDAGPTPRSPETGAGVLGRWGTFTLTNPYFEHNAGWDMWFGTETPPGAQTTTVTVINPVLSHIEKLNDTGAFRAEHGIVTVLGGDYGHTPHPVSLGAGVRQVYLLANVPNVETEHEGGLAAVPGLIMNRASNDGRGVLTGAYDIQAGSVTASGSVAAHQVAIGGGTSITRHLSFTHPWTPGPVPHGGTATVYVDTPGTGYGDTVVVSFNHGGQGLGVGVMLSGSVAGDGGKVGVTLLNMKGESLTLNRGTLRIDVWKH
ncbi:MAG TPA: glycosyl hydrolase family 28-related protein [Longimicrobium sp.]|nr:glycosyl hydrolase family 28-related protein [Longimicrobium sp.]